MFRRSRTLLATVAVVAGTSALVAPVGPAGAVENDLTVSASSGAPGDEIVVSSASCAQGSDFSILDARLVAGTGADRVLVAAGSSDAATPTTLTLPDWPDDTLPANLEASCYSFDDDSEEVAEFEFDPVTFDLLPGPGPATQIRSFSRTTLAAGQGFVVDGEGCAIDPAAQRAVFVEIYAGSDRSGENWTEWAGSGFGLVEADGSFRAEAIVSNANFSVSTVSQDGDVVKVETSEQPMDLAPGDYVAVAYCVDIDGEPFTFQPYEPQVIEVTKVKPTTSIDLTFDPDRRAADLTGGNAGAGTEVTGRFHGEDGLFEFGPIDAVERLRTARSGPADDTQQISIADLWTQRGRTSTRTIRDEAETPFTATADSAGAWSASDEIAFDEGFVYTSAAAGDPFADGFVYDPQAVGFLAAPQAPPPTTPTTQPPRPAPANAVPGSPNFTG